MKKFKPYLGEETGFEEYPDLMGIKYGGEEIQVFDPRLGPLTSLDWSAYQEIITDLAPRHGSRKIWMKLSTGQLILKLSFRSGLISVLDQIPILEVFRDSPTDMGPGGDGAILVFAKSGANRAALKLDIERVAEALACDFRINT